jgi:uncharacterized repeat protein (TIGR01451 family)
VWEKPINTSNNSIGTDPNDNIIVLAKNNNATQLSKFTKNGLLIWSNRLSKAAAFTPSGSVVVDRQGNIYTFTEGFDSVNSQFTGIKPTGITKFDPNGNVLWHNYYSATGPKLAIQIDNNDNVYVGYYEFGTTLATITLGSTTTTVSPFNYYLSIGSISSSGTVRWVRGFQFFNLTTGGHTGANSISLSGNTLFVSGYSGKYSLVLDNSLTLTNDRCSAWLAAFDCSNGQSIWGKTHALIYYCAGIVCGCYAPSMNTSVSSDKVMLINNLNGAFIFQPADTIASIMSSGLTTVKTYYTSYDTFGNPVKGKIFENQFTDNKRILNRGNFYFVQMADSLIKVDTGFNRIWQFTLPSSPAFVDNIYAPQNNNDFLFTYTRGGIIYLAKMTDSAGVISGRTYADWDNNAIYTSADSVLSNIVITSNNAVTNSISGNDSGKYYMYASPGVYNLNANFSNPFYQFLPATQTATINQFSDTVPGKDFRLRPLFNFTDVAVNFSALSAARPGSSITYNVTVKNFGPTVTSIDVGLKLPPLTSYNTVTGGTVTVNSADSITIAMGNVNPFETKTARLYLYISTTATTADTLKYYLKADPYTTDTIKTNNIDSLIQNIRTSFDPNEKEVNVTKHPLSDSSNALAYTVHFQNTGNDTAFYVRIADTLSPKLNLSTFSLIDASHVVTTEIKNNVINFIFNPIILPDSIHNEEKSHGFVKYKIKLASPVIATDTIFNRAGIYFDYNAAVITNITKSWFILPQPIPVILKTFVAQNNNNAVLLKFTTASEPGLNNFIIERSNDGITYNLIGSLLPKGADYSGGAYSFEDGSPYSGINFYRLKMVDKDQRFTYSWIVIVQFNNKDQQVKIFPNPANDNLYITFTSMNAPEIFSCLLTDASGKNIWVADLNTTIRNTLSVNTTTLPDGIYFVSVKNNHFAYRQKVIIKH